VHESRVAHAKESVPNVKSDNRCIRLWRWQWEQKN